MASQQHMYVRFMQVCYFIARSVCSTHTVAAKKKSGDVSVPFRPVQTEAKQPFHAQKNGNGTVQGTATGKRWTCCRLFQSQLARKRCLESLRRPKEALLYPSASIWRRSESINSVRLIDHQQLASIPIEPPSQNSPKIEEQQQSTAQKTLEDGSSIKLSILVGEQMSRLSIFTLWKTMLIIANCTCVCMERLA